LDFFLSGGRPKGPTEESLLVEASLLSPSPNQPRREIREQELQELAASVRASGILQPILVRRSGEGFQIVAGERRWRAARLAGLEKVPVLVRTISDDESAVFGLVENLQREDLNAIEKALAFSKLIDRFQCSHEDVAKRVGLDRSTVANFVRLLDLPESVREFVSRGTLSMGHARALLSVPEDAERIRLAEAAVRGGHSVRQLEILTKHAALGPTAEITSASAKPKKGRPIWLNELEETLVETLGTPVTVRYGRKRSQITIDCAGREEFERIFERLKKA